MRGYLALGYTTVKMKIGGAPLDEDLRRIEAVLEVVDGDGSRLAVDANGRFDLETALAYADALAPYGLRWYEEAGDPLDYELQARLGEVYPHTLATGREPLLDAGRAQPDPLRRDAPGPGRAPVRLRPLVRSGRVPAHPRHAGRARLVAADGRAPRRAPDLARTWPPGWGWAGTSRTPASSSPSAASPTRSRSRTATSPCRTPRVSASRRRRPLGGDARAGGVVRVIDR